ncbi:probable WRKY transcription factor 53 [Abrus precatorius]|uniref:Probable WRKY transcription factor 53 n=1 Tax=Abrus precatorius TaxID=3816 RepID=A0A8B8M4H0_ABRPR|nr:probable WRKY transcription factor 53 [Abrus precatorius]
MESERNREQKALVNELIQGLEIARKLEADLKIPSSVDTRDSLLQRILSCYDKSLLILRWNAFISKPHTMQHATKTSSPESPVSVERSSPRENVPGGVKELKHNPKKRKMVPEWMDHVKVKIESGVEGPYEDGYNWRKYGQKDILGAKYPRNYYRCTFRNTRGCCATKHVQRSDEDATIFDIVYRGSHTCGQGNDAVLPPKSPDIQEKTHGYDSDVVHLHHAHPSQENPTNFSNILTVNQEMAYPFGCMTQDNHTLLPSSVPENDPMLSSISNFLSPHTPETISYFPSLIDKPYPDSDVAWIVSTDTSASNIPIFDFNFSLETEGIYSNFPFN